MAPTLEVHRASLDAFLPVAALGALSLLQGGFYPGATCVVALLATLAAAVRRLALHGREPVCFASLALLALGLVTAISAWVHGATATMLLGSTRWLALAGMTLLLGRPSYDMRRRTIDVLTVCLVVLSALGLLMYLGVLPFAGTVSAGRLMFSFQYANAAGILFAVAVVLCLANERPVLKAFAIVPLVALALTRSAGAIGTLLLVVVFLATQRLFAAATTSRMRLAIVVGLGAAGIVFAIALNARLAEVSQTLIERLVQVLDASSLLVGNAALGIGPDQWQLAFPVIQTAAYRATRLHASYLQLVLDGGVVAMLAMGLLVFRALRETYRRREWGPCACVAMLAIHALLDFDLSFSALVLLLCVLGDAPSGDDGDVADSSAHLPQARRVLWWPVAGIAIVSSFAALSVDAHIRGVTSAAVAGDAVEALAQLRSNDLLERDPLARAPVIAALVASDAYEDALVLTDADDVTATSGVTATTSATALGRVVALESRGDTSAAAGALAALLAARPYDVELYATARDFLAQGTDSPELISAFNDAIRVSNRLLTSGHASWLATQDPIQPIAAGDGDA